MNRWFDAFISLFFPRCCIVCGYPLAKGEEVLCVSCNIDMPRTNLHLQKDNTVERLFWGKIPLVRATSYFYYRKGSDYCRILFQLKYEGQKEVGEVMGRYMAAELLASGFFATMDVIVPVPLHPKKQRSRGYNQSEWIARGVSAVTGLPVDITSVIRHKNTETQTRKSASQRLENVMHIFTLLHPECFTGKHVLIIDDVLTTGATTVACASAFQEVEGVRISVLTMAAAD
ncbi:MAG: ComF family protein [Bacteroides sp.]